MAEPVSPVPPQAAPRNASRKRIILMLVLGTLNINSSSGGGALPALGAIGFVGGVLTFIVGVLWGLARWIDRKRPPKPA